jgi:hypothetical protein
MDKQPVANITTDIASKASQAVESVKSVIPNIPIPDNVKSAVEGKSFIVFVLLGGVVAAFLLAAVLYYIVKRTMKRSKTYVVPETKRPLLCTTLTKGDGSALPTTTDGKRVTITFWIYINDLNTNMGQIRRIFNRGVKDTSSLSGITGSSPFVGLNSMVNKIHVIFPSSESSQYMQDGVDKAMNFASATIDQKVDYLSAIHGITIDYIPMQRWVHVGVVVNEDSTGGSVMAYIDGELVKTVTTSETIRLEDNPESEAFLEVRNLELTSRGDVWIGGESGSMPGFSGLVSQVGITGTDLNAKDIYNMYLRGPVDSVVGIPGYGVQSPIYRLG